MKLTSNGRIIGHRLKRPEPGTPVDKMLTYSVASPRSTHTRPATCEEAGCRAWRRGFTITLPVGSDKIDHLKRAMRGEEDGIKRLDARVERDGTMIHVHFAKGTSCMGATRHRVNLHRPEIYIVRSGDWRANLGVLRQHKRPDHWVEDFATTLDKSRKVINGRS